MADNRCVVCRVTKGSSNNHVPGLPFHRFPKDSGRRRLWRDALQLKAHDQEHWLVCGRHFKLDDYKESAATNGSRRLKPHALPSLLLSQHWNRSFETLQTPTHVATATCAPVNLVPFYGVSQAPPPVAKVPDIRQFIQSTSDELKDKPATRSTRKCKVENNELATVQQCSGNNSGVNVSESIPTMTVNEKQAVECQNTDTFNVAVNELRQLFTLCNQPNCRLPVTAKFSSRGEILQVKWHCPSGHEGFWTNQSNIINSSNTLPTVTEPKILAAGGIIDNGYDDCTSFTTYTYRV